MKNLFPELEALCDELVLSFDQITDERKKALLPLAQDISQMRAKHSFANIIAVCTHNSRRSQLAQLWIKTAAFYFGHFDIYTYSGGTEATAFNHRMVSAIERVGFLVESLNHFSNPKYHIPLSEEDMRYDIYYSKKYSENYNPQNVFVALLLCGSADESCPIVAGATYRHFIPYVDPGEADNTPSESDVYGSKVFEIGREMLYLISKIK